ncbi:MAG: hypothetical protein ACRC4U_06370, partial [Shewanella sp.]
GAKIDHGAPPTQLRLRFLWHIASRARLNEPLRLRHPPLIVFVSSFSYFPDIPPPLFTLKPQRATREYRHQKGTTPS